MNIDSVVKKMLENYRDQKFPVDQLREILQQTALLDVVSHLQVHNP